MNSVQQWDFAKVLKFCLLNADLTLLTRLGDLGRWSVTACGAGYPLSSMPSHCSSILYFVLHISKVYFMRRLKILKSH